MLERRIVARSKSYKGLKLIKYPFRATLLWLAMVISLGATYERKRLEPVEKVCPGRSLIAVVLLAAKSD